MKKRDFLMLAVLLLEPTRSALAEQQIDSFDDISGYSVFGGLVHQGAAPDPIDEGISSLVVDYAAGDTDAVYLNRYITPIDLSAEAAAGGVMSIRMWVAAETVTARIITMQFETAYQSEFSYSWPLNQTWDTGWNTVVVPLADFVVVDTSGTPSWSSIGQLKMQTGMYPTPPAEAVGDVILDDWRVLDALPFDAADLNRDGFVDGLDLGLLLGNWNQNTTPDMGELNGIDPVDGLDLGLFLGAWNPPPPSGVAVVPEPAGVALALIGGLIAVRARANQGSSTSSVRWPKRKSSCRSFG